MAEETTTPASTVAPQRPEGVPPVLDDAHIGDIQGALGTIRMDESGPRHGWRSRAMALLAIMGPGLIVMVGDNDAGGVATYSQAGQTYGTTLLWTLLLLIPVLIVNQEMVIRLGAITGVGHARLIFERFGHFFGWFSVGDLFLLNFLTLVTEFIGVSLALTYFGVDKYIAVPVAALTLIAITMTGSFRSWERFMYVFVAANFLVIPLAIMAQPDVGTIVHDTFVPSIKGGVSSNSILLIIAIVGTTVAPWQLFFQQSNIIDKHITTRWINYERADTVIGAFVVVIGAGALMVVTAFALGMGPNPLAWTDAGGTAEGLKHAISSTAGTFFAIVLLNASLIGAAAVTLATSYAFGDVFGASHSLNRGPSDAKGFYITFAALVVCAAGIVLIPGAPLGVITEGVQALAGVLLPSATIFLLLLCNDHEVLGPWCNKLWVNMVATVIVSVLLVLSIILTVNVAFPSVSTVTLVEVLGAAMIVGLLSAGALLLIRGAPPWPFAEMSTEERNAWTMPPLALLKRPKWSLSRQVVMLGLRLYLVVGVVLLVVKMVQLGGG